MRTMAIVRAAVVALCALGAGGCFASWVGVQASGNQRILEEGAREVTVPQPGVHEQLALHLPLGPALGAAPPSSAAGTAAGPPAPAPAPAPVPLEIGCEATQSSRDVVHRSAFRYGTKWKYATATFFVLEAATAAAFYFGDRDAPDSMLAAGLLGLDAVGSAALFFAPRKEVFRTEERPTGSRVRDDCPDGIALDIGGEVYPVDAAGRIGELGEAAIDAWMLSPGAPIRATYAGRTVELSIDHSAQCAWKRSHHPEQPELLAGCPLPGTFTPRQVSTRFEVPMGTLTRIEPVDAGEGGEAAESGTPVPN